MIIFYYRRRTPDGPDKNPLRFRVGGGEWGAGRLPGNDAPLGVPLLQEAWGSRLDVDVPTGAISHR